MTEFGPFLNNFGFTVANDAMDLLVGRKLGEGSFRQVYELAFDTSMVLKFELGRESFYNIAEWEIWNSCPKDHQRWLAPCIKISAAGTVLVQSKVEPTKRRPKKIPDWMDDNKLSNWGIYKGRVVCCDYGHHRFFKNGFRRARLVSGAHMWRTPIRSL